MSLGEKPIVWLTGRIKTPPLTREARIEGGSLLGQLQKGEALSMPHSRPMPSIGKRCHELRIVDENQTWRIIYRTDADAIIVAEIFSKKTRGTPKRVIDLAKRRLVQYDEVVKNAKKDAE